MVVLTIKEGEPFNLYVEIATTSLWLICLELRILKILKRDYLLDCAYRTFLSNRKSLTQRVFWEAKEFISDNQIGYSFEIHQDFEEDPNDALKRLYKR